MNRHWHGDNRSSGFTLLEVMVAMAILAIALTAVLGSQSQSLSLAADAKFNTTAPLLAKGKMAEAEAEDPDNLVSDSGDFGEDFPGYTWEMTVNDVALGGTGNVSDFLKEVDLTVAWGDGGLYEYHLRLYRFVEP